MTEAKLDRDDFTDIKQDSTSKIRTPLIDVLDQLKRSTNAIVGAIMFFILILAAISAPWVAPRDPIQMSGPEGILQPPSSSNLLGTDQFGRDIFSRILHGAPVTLRLGLISVAIAATAGTAMGMASGYWGGWTDIFIMRGVDIMLAFPGILLALVVVAVLGPGLNNTMVAVGVSTTPTFARVVRGSVLAAKENLYVEAARAVGARDYQIIGRHLLPNVVAPVIVLSTLGLGTAILFGAALSFLGLGAQPPTAEWGSMLSTGRDYLREHWWISTFPGVSIMFTVVAVNLLGDGLRDALDPRLRL